MKRKVTRAILLSVLLLLGRSLAFACTIVDIRPTVSRNIRLVVKDGKFPIKQADVFVTQWKLGRPTVVAQGKTDDHGTAEFRNLTPGDYDVSSSAWPPYTWTTAFRVTTKDGTSEIRAKVMPPPQKLPPPVFVRGVDGVVVDPSGAVFPNATFVLERVDEAHTPVAAGQTSDDGRLSVKVPGGFYIMRVAHRTFQTAVVPIFVGVESDAWTSFQLTLKPSPCGFTGMSHDIRPLN